MKSLSQQLVELEHCLKRHGHWQSQSPSKLDLTSPTPFSADTLSPCQWLQFVFIPKLGALIDDNKLPSAMQLSPYFSECFELSLSGRAELLKRLERLDSEFGVTNER
ncbi:YqcC family protein [Alginatibacterium sediminis]|uniref:YqcC family protein n=1 Tax=Alginatibacterium sediminis TaxID=2164068 RepID=A0A420E7K1_9ALTE|nr:YqcC family protein [Alginatibacterium sediminis]RKF15519.1 YqcC family protein [Alginatibacterium sediminis]